MPDLFLDGAELLPPFGAFRRLGEEQLDVTGNEGEGRADLVGEGGRHLAGGGEHFAPGQFPPRLEELLDRALQFGVSLAERRGRVRDLGFEGGREALDAGEHLVEGGCDIADFVGSDHGRTAATLALKGAAYRVAQGPQWREDKTLAHQIHEKRDHEG